MAVSISQLLGMGEDPADLATDLHPYLRLEQAVEPQGDSGTRGNLEIAQRRLRTQKMTPGGRPQPPELAGVDADARVPNPLQPMSGEFADGHEVSGGRPAFHNPMQPPPTGVASRETVAAGPLQRLRNSKQTAKPDLLAGVLRPVGNEQWDASLLAPR